MRPPVSCALIVPLTSQCFADLFRRADALMLALATLLCCAPAFAEDDAGECAQPFDLLTLVNRWNSLYPERKPVLADIGDGHE